MSVSAVKSNQYNRRTCERDEGQLTILIEPNARELVTSNLVEDDGISIVPSNWIQLGILMQFTFFQEGGKSTVNSQVSENGTTFRF